MAILADLKRKRAMKQYARKLPRRLYTDYGASTFFTPGQIKTAATKLKLAPEFMVYGYAMFLSEDVFEELKPTMQNQLSYEEARAGIMPYNLTTATADSNFYERYLGFFSPGDGGTGGTGLSNRVQPRPPFRVQC